MSLLDKALAEPRHNKHAAKWTKSFGDAELQEVALAALAGVITANQFCITLGVPKGSFNAALVPILRRAYADGRLRIVEVKDVEVK